MINKLHVVPVRVYYYDEVAPHWNNLSTDINIIGKNYGNIKYGPPKEEKYKYQNANRPTGNNVYTQNIRKFIEKQLWTDSCQGEQMKDGLSPPTSSDQQPWSELWYKTSNIRSPYTTVGMWAEIEIRIFI